MKQDTKESLEVVRDLVMDEDTDGTRIVYAVAPETVDDTGESMVSESIHVSDDATKRYLGDLFVMFADPDGFASEPARSR